MEINESVMEYLALLGSLWQIDRLEDRLTVVPSWKMIRTLGNCRPESGLIRLSGILFREGNGRVFREVLCHEAAHAAVFFIFGKGRRPHGREWRSLMEKALHLPRTRIPEGEILGLAPSGKKGRYLYFHRCSHCGIVFRKKRTDRRWRCKSCLMNGLEGKLRVVKRQKL